MIAGLIDVASIRADAMGPLLELVAAVVDELDPDHVRDTQPTWLTDLPAWARLDPLDRFRKAAEDLRLLEVQAEEIVMDLRVMLIPSAVRPGRSWRQAHRDLGSMSSRRERILIEMARAERRLRANLSPVTSAEVRSAIRKVRAEEVRAGQYRQRLDRLLSMVDRVA